MRALLAAVAAAGLTAPAPYPVMHPGIRLSFPAEHGAHPAFRTEWWYVTGWLKGADGPNLGFQVTFFRANPHAAAGNPSRFAATQVIFAHAALSDPRVGRILHAERAARAGFDLAGAATGDADVRLNGWTFRRVADGRFTTRVGGPNLSFDLTFRLKQPPLRQERVDTAARARNPSRPAIIARSRISPSPVPSCGAASPSACAARHGSTANGRPTTSRPGPPAGTGLG